MGREWKNWVGGTPLEGPPYSPDLAPCNFWAFPTMKMKLQGKKFRSNQTVCSTFSRSGWSVVRSAPLAKGSISNKRPSPHLYKVPARSNKFSPRTLQMAPVYRQHVVPFTRCIQEISALNPDQDLTQISVLPHSFPTAMQVRIPPPHTSQSPIYGISYSRLLFHSW
jgi:hypothetical protein